MNEYPRLKIYPYIAFVLLLTVALAASSLFLIDQAPFDIDFTRIWMLPAFTLTIALAGALPFRISPQGDATISTAPIFIAVLLLHPVEAVLVSVIGTLIAESWMRAHPEAISFNAGSNGLIAAISGIVFHFLKPDGDGIFNGQVLLIAILSGVTFHVVNHLLVFLMIVLIRGRSVWQRWLDAWKFAAILDTGLIAFGLIGAQLIAQNWWWSIILMLPFAIAYFGYRRSMTETVEKTELAEQLERNLNELKETQSQLVQSAKLAGIGTLSAGLAHEINNPLTVITGRAELLIAKMRRSPESVESDQVIKEVQNIHEMGVRISTIMRQLLTYSRKSEHLSDVPLDMVLDDATQLLRGKIDKKGIELNKEYNNPPRVWGVANQLQQVFVNILGNAIDASPDLSRVTIGCNTCDDALVAYVKDEGGGIPTEVQERIFEPFFTTKEVGEGTGLGLYICHMIIEDHNGEITIDSNEGKGTTFSVRLPLAKMRKDKSISAA